jgi:hypothetical protein
MPVCPNLDTSFGEIDATHQGFTRHVLHGSLSAMRLALSEKYHPSLFVGEQMRLGKRAFHTKLTRYYAGPTHVSFLN